MRIRDKDFPAKKQHQQTHTPTEIHKPQIRYLGSRSFSFLDFSDVIDALDLMSSERFIFLG